MPSWTSSQLRTQFNRASAMGWLPYFYEAARKFPAFDAADYLAIASRETNLDPKWLKKAGDAGNGYGLMQADKRYFPEWVATGQWRDARSGILKGAEILNAKRKEALDAAGKRKTVTSRRGQKATFTGTPLSKERLRLVSFAMYNSGLWGYYHEVKSGDPDRGTTGADYSRDVDARARMFRKWLAEERDEDIRPLAHTVADARPDRSDPVTAQARPVNNFTTAASVSSMSNQEVKAGSEPISTTASSPVSTSAQSEDSAGAGAVPIPPAESNVTIEQAGGVTVEAQAPQPVATDPANPVKVTAGSGSWIRTVLAWMGAAFTSLQENIREIFNLTPENQRLVFGAVVLGGVVYLLFKFLSERQIRNLAADTSKNTVK